MAGATPPRSRKNRARGFTLIELTVVLFLMGIFVFAAVPNIQNFLFSSDLESAARSMKAVVRLVRSKSILTGRYTALCIDLDRNAYWGEFDEPDAREKPFTGSGADKKLMNPRQLPKGLRFVDAASIRLPKATSGQVRSIFNPKGVVEETVVHLADKRNRIMTIVINAFTGRFSIYNEYVDVEYENTPLFFGGD